MPKKWCPVCERLTLIGQNKKTCGVECGKIWRCWTADQQYEALLDAENGFEMKRLRRQEAKQQREAKRLAEAKARGLNSIDELNELEDQEAEEAYEKSQADQIDRYSRLMGVKPGRIRPEDLPVAPDELKGGEHDNESEKS